MFWLTGLLGLALIAAPWVLQYTDNSNALWTSIIIGVVVLGVSAYKAVMGDRAYWEYWVAGLAGVVAIVAPFVLNFSGWEVAAMWACVGIGALMVILDGYEVFFAQPEAPA